MSDAAKAYDASSIEVLYGLDAVRKRPGMYIGSTGPRGLHHMVFEIVNLAVTEVLRGRATRVDVTLTADGGVRVVDDGPGKRVDVPESSGASQLEALLTELQLWAKPRPRRFNVGGFGTMLAIVNALSVRMTAEVGREGVRWVYEFARGVSTTPLTAVGPATSTGTTFSFWPDPEVFETTDWSFDALAARFKELALLNRPLEISLTDLRGGGEHRAVRFRFPGGTADFVALLDGVEAQVITVEREDIRMGGTLDLSFQWRGSGESRILSFANSEPTVRGTHEQGFRDGVASAVSAYVARRQTPRQAPGSTVDPSRVVAGLTAVVSVKLDHPSYDGCTRGVLGNAEAYTAVFEAVRDDLGAWFDANPEQADDIVGRMI